MMGDGEAQGNTQRTGLSVTVTGAPAKSGVRHPPIPSLDGLRAIAVLIVVCSHAGFGNQVPGGLGVTIFFFLSGYLITTLLLDEYDDWGAIDIKSFYLRRAYRLLPPLVVTLAVAYGLLAIDRVGGGFSWGGLASQLFYFANYHAIFFDSEAATPAGTGILWSLAVEEHFYIIYPLVMLGVLRVGRDRQRIGVFLAVLAAVVLLWRIWLVSRPGFEDLRTYYATDTRFDSILFGCVLALWWNPVRPVTRSPTESPYGRRELALAGGACVLLLATVAYRDAAYRETVRYTLQGVALFPIFHAAIRAPELWPFRMLNTRLLARIGVLSYGIYLVHFIVIEVINSAEIDVPATLKLPVVLGVSIAFATLVDRFVDPYFRRKRAELRPGAHRSAPERTVSRPA